MFGWFVLRNFGLYWMGTLTWFLLVILDLATRNKVSFLGTLALMIALVMVAALVHGRAYVGRHAYTWSRATIGMATALLIYLPSLLFFLGSIGMSLIKNAILRGNDQAMFVFYDALIGKVTPVFAVLMLCLGGFFALNAKQLFLFPPKR